MPPPNTFNTEFTNNNNSTDINSNNNNNNAPRTPVKKPIAFNNLGLSMSSPNGSTVSLNVVEIASQNESHPSTPISIVQKAVIVGSELGASSLASSIQSNRAIHASFDNASSPNCGNINANGRIGTPQQQQQQQPTMTLTHSPRDSPRRKYFDSGDYELARAGILSATSVGSIHASPERILSSRSTSSIGTSSRSPIKQSVSMASFDEGRQSVGLMSTCSLLKFETVAGSCSREELDLEPGSNDRKPE